MIVLFFPGCYKLYVICDSGRESEGLSDNVKTAHQLSHERAEIRYQSRLPAWQQQQPVTSSDDDHVTLSSIIAGASDQRCAKVRRCRCFPSSLRTNYAFG